MYWVSVRSGARGLGQGVSATRGARGREGFPGRAPRAMGPAGGSSLCRGRGFSCYVKPFRTGGPRMDMRPVLLCGTDTYLLLGSCEQGQGVLQPDLGEPGGN